MEGLDGYVRRLLEAQKISEWHFRDELQEIIEEVSDVEIRFEIVRDIAGQVGQA